MKKEEFVRHIEYNDVQIDLGIDDAGQCYFIEYVDYNSGSKHIESCGAYNTNYMDYIESRFGEPETNCEHYNSIKITRNKGCSFYNKGFCYKCDKRLSKKDHKIWLKRFKKFKKWLKKNETHIP